MLAGSLIPSLAVPKNPHKMVLKNNALLVLVYLSHLLLSSDSCEHKKLFKHFTHLYMKLSCSKVFIVINMPAWSKYKRVVYKTMIRVVIFCFKSC